MRLNDWKMKPISRLRMRARSAAPSFSTCTPDKVYEPLVGVSSRPRIERSVDLPQPEGPPMETYSPLRTSNWMSERACVSSSSV